MICFLSKKASKLIWLLEATIFEKVFTFPSSISGKMILLFSGQILIQSVCETMVPKLVAEDIPLLFSLLSDVFPGIEYTRAQMSGLKEEIRKVGCPTVLLLGGWLPGMATCC